MTERIGQKPLSMSHDTLSRMLVKPVLDDRVALRRTEPSSDCAASQASGPRWRPARLRACRGGWTSQRREGPGGRNQLSPGASASTRPGSTLLRPMPCRSLPWTRTGLPGPSKVTTPLPGCAHALSLPLCSDCLVCLDASLLALPRQAFKRTKQLDAWALLS